MKILHITANSNHGGISRYLSTLIEHMDRRCQTTSVIAGAQGTWHDLFEQPCYQWITCPTNGSPFDVYRAARTIIHQLKNDPPDLIHTHYRKSTWVARIVQRHFRVPVLFTLHLTHIPMTGYWRWLTSWGDHVHVPSQQAKQWILNNTKVPSARISAIPHGIEPKTFPLTTQIQRDQARKRFQLSDQQVALAYVGRLEPSKNPEWLLEVTNRIKASSLPAKLIVQGDGPSLNWMKNQVQAQQLVNHIDFYPYQNPLPLYQAADMVVIPSQYEGFSLMCLEAMSTGLPVIRTQTAGAEEMIIQGQTGYATAIERQAFVQQVITAISDPDHLRVMGQKAHQHVYGHLTLNHQVDRTYALYQSLVSAD